VAADSSRFPQYIPFLYQAGVFQVLADSINGKWSDIDTQAALQHTKYFTERSLVQRQWDALQATDPATAGQRVVDKKRIIDDLGQQLGILLEGAAPGAGGLNTPAFDFLVSAVAQDWDANRIRYEMLASVNATHAGGQLGQSAARVKSMADDYAVVMSDQSAFDWGRKLSQGAVDEQGVQGYLIEQAKSRLPGLADALDRGITVRQYADQYLQIAQQELGINPSTVSLTDPKWLAALDQVDQKTGQHYTMTASDWTSHIRKEPTYGYASTFQGKQARASLETQLAQKMGVLG
jgi:hypothetical protein